jgi:hypothetical protein
VVPSNVLLVPMPPRAPELTGQENISREGHPTRTQIECQNVQSL